MTSPAMRVCATHGRAHRVTEDCPWCPSRAEAKEHETEPTETVCAYCSTFTNMYYGYVTECFWCQRKLS